MQKRISMGALRFVLVWLIFFPVSVKMSIDFLTPILEQKMASYRDEHGTCTILKHAYESRSWEEGTDYLMQLTYEVVTPQGEHVKVTGYNGPRGQALGSQSEAEAVFKQYPVGSVHPCWFRKGKPTEAVLVINFGEYVSSAIGLGVTGGILLTCIISWLLAFFSYAWKHVEWGNGGWKYAGCMAIFSPFYSVLNSDIESEKNAVQWFLIFFGLFALVLGFCSFMVFLMFLIWFLGL